MKDFERRLEGAVEGFFARTFRSGLQPVELAKSIQRYAKDYQQVGLDGTYIYNVYRFTLSGGDLERFSGFTQALQRELADVVRRTADEHGWRTQGPIRIEFERGDDIREGLFELRGKVEESAGRPAPARARSGATAVLPRQDAPAGNGRPSAPEGVLRVVAGADAGAVFEVPVRATVGRLPECEITLADASVSRRHARLQREGERWTVTDLGSTNGVKVNGTGVRAAEVRHGDRVEFGTVACTFSAAP